MTDPYAKLYRVFDYGFKDCGLLQSALTHRSAGKNNNERLEFLGDAVLCFLIAEELFSRFSTAPEGDLSRLRANLVKKETLADVARSVALGEFLRLGAGEMKSGGFRRDSILADAMESIVAAIYLDSGIEPCRKFILRMFGERLDALSDGAALKDAKTRLQEYLQARQMELPVYEVVRVTGKAHAQSFAVECRSTGVGRTTLGEARSRRKAEQRAAQRMLDELQL